MGGVGKLGHSTIARVETRAECDHSRPGVQYHDGLLRDLDVTATNKTLENGLSYARPKPGNTFPTTSHYYYRPMSL